MLLSKIDRALAQVSPRGGRAKAVIEETGSDTGLETMAGAIGQRYETIQSGLEDLYDLAEKFKAFEPLLAQIKTPLSEDFDARRGEYLELVNLRLSQGDATQRIEALATENRRLSTTLADLEGKHDEIVAQNGEQSAAAQDSRIEMDRIRNACSMLETELVTTRAARHENAQRVAELEQDVAALRDQVATIEIDRSEVETGRTQAVRDHALATNENAAMRKRLEELGAEVARLARSEASLEGQLTTERARTGADQNEHARALRALETQVETSRAEASAMQIKLETATARSERLETINVDLGSRLADLQASSQTTDRRSAEMQTNLYRALERIRDLEAGVEEARQRHAAMETARLAAVDRAENMAKSYGVQEKALARGEDRTAKLQGQLSELRSQHEAEVSTLTDQITALKSSQESFRAEAAMVSGALETARRDRPSRDVVTRLGEPTAPARAANA